MNQQFEVMPFGAPDAAPEMEQELEQERGGRGGGGRAPSVRGPGPRAPKGGPRAWPRYYPRYYPVYGGGGPWWYGDVYPSDWPHLHSQPQPPGADTDVDGEPPKALRDALGRLPAARRPPSPYVRLGALKAALPSLGPGRAGLYLIVFRANGRTRAYSGQSDDVRRRLQQHQLCATILDVDTGDHQVYLAATPSMSEARRRQIERDIHTDIFQHDRSLLTNQRRELEVELLGEAWH